MGSQKSNDLHTLKAFLEQMMLRHGDHNITTEEGIIQRINRSIQAEGMFAKLKDGLKYDRFRHRDMKGIILDIPLTAIGINLNKLLKMTKDQMGVIEYKKVALS